MKKKITIWLLVVSLGGALIGWMLTHSYKVGLCAADFVSNTFDVSCNQTLLRAGLPLEYGMSALALVFIVLLLVPQAWRAWKKFAIWYVPLAALLFIFYPEPGSGDLFSPYPETVFKWVSVLYVVVSILIIFAASRKKN